MTTKKTWMVPFDSEGNMVVYVDARAQWRWQNGKPFEYGEEGLTFKDNFVWPDTLKIVDYSRGRSSAIFILKSIRTERKYFVFMKDMMEILKYSELGMITGIFTFAKRGTNFGVRRLVLDN